VWLLLKTMAFLVETGMGVEEHLGIVPVQRRVG